MTSNINLSTIESLRVAVCDLNGTLRGKRIPASQLNKALDGKVRMPLSVIGVDIWGEDVLDNAQVFETGDRDGVCEYTGRGVLPIDWTPSPTALIPLWLKEENGEPFSCDPRQSLARIINRFDELGLTPVVATELEFYLFDPENNIPCPPSSPVTGKRLNSDSILSISELDEFDAFFHDVYRACEQHGIPADSAIAENGCGQFEINLLHVDNALKAADDAVLFKNLVKGLARKHNVAASFMAKPYGDRSGSGFHVHFSLLDKNGNNVFDDSTESGSDVLKHAVGGLLNAMPESALLFAPHWNSYRRLAPGSLAPTAISWGYENRTTAVRIPGGPPQARRIEHRVAGADANPYLVIAGILGAALLGIEQQIIPDEPTSGDAYSSDAQILPTSWQSALETFTQGRMVREIFSDELCQMLIACKKQEMNVFARQVTDFEYLSYLEVV